jgi:DNA-binding HxlR family transcriptional regulator
VKRSTKSICLADVVLRILRGRWATSILTIIAKHDSIHFNGLKRAIPDVSAKVLAQQLRYLEEAGVVERHPTEKARGEVTYSYTKRGTDLKQCSMVSVTWRYAGPRSRRSKTVFALSDRFLIHFYTVGASHFR